MNGNIGIIGGADGPTAVYISSGFLPEWLNPFGLILVVLILLPNIYYAWKRPGQVNLCRNRFLNILEQIGRYSCMFLMAFSIGIMEYGFLSGHAVLWYFFGNLFLLAGYWIGWFFYLRRPSRTCAVWLSLLPAGIFLLSGITTGRPLLAFCAVLFGFSHCCVSLANHPPQRY